MDKPPRTTNTQVREWNEAIKDWTDQTTPSDGYSPQHPAFLWKVCWEQLNTIKIPLYSAELFFNKALEIAKDEDVTNSEEFMRRFKKNTEQYQDRLEEFFDIVYRHLSSRVFRRDMETPCSPTQDAWKSVYNVYEDRSYVNFLQLLKGITVGWLPDSVVRAGGDDILRNRPVLDNFRHLLENYLDRDVASFQELYSCGPYKNDLYNGYNGHDYGCDIPPHGVAMLIGERYLRKRKRIRHDYNDCTLYPLSDRNIDYGFKYVEACSDTHLDGESTQLGERSQIKREKKVRFDGISDDDNKQRSKRQKLERSTADSSSFEYVQGETAAGTSDNQMSESHTADPPLSHASSSFTQPIKEERPAKRSKRQRQEHPTADSPSSFTAFSSSGNTEERPAKRVRRQLPENDTAGSSLPHASSTHTERVEGKRPAKRIKREMPEDDTAGSLLPHASSSYTERVEGKRPAKRARRQMPENDTAGSLLPHASSSRTERAKEGSSAGRPKRQRRGSTTADSSLSPIPSSTRITRGAAKRLERQK